MIATVGYAGILVAGVSAVGLIVQGARAFGGRIGPDRLRLPAWGIAVGAIVAMGALELALLTDDFSIEYVARNHSRDTPLVFTIASAWASLEGDVATIVAHEADVQIILDNETDLTRAKQVIDMALERRGWEYQPLKKKGQK